jgi:hypothetical protein
VKSLKSPRSSNYDIKGDRDVKSRYKNIEDAKFTEIKDEDKEKDKE